MKDTDYAYAVARIRANEKKLLTNSDLEQLIDEPSFESAVKFLDDKGWLLGNDFDSISDAVDKQNHDMTALIKESLPNKDDFKRLTVQNDFFNLKTSIKSMLGGENPFPNYIYPTSVDLERLTTLVGNLEFEKLDPMFAVCAEEAYKAACQTENGQAADIIIDKATLEFIRKLAKKSKGSILGEIYDFLCDSVNIKIAYRCALTGKDIAFAEKSIGSCARLASKLLCEKAVQGVQALSEYLLKTEYKKGTELLLKSTSAFEKWCDDTVTEIAKKAKLSFFGFDPICAYYYAKKAEIKSVRIILSGKESGISSDIIRERVRSLYV